MLFEQVRSVVVLAALITLIGFLIEMSSLMVTQVSFGSERLLTEPALIWSLPCVLSHMYIEVSFFIADLATHFARMLSACLEVVALDVESESESSGEHLAAVFVRALENLL